MSVFDNQVHQCERCRRLYTIKETNDKKIKYYIHVPIPGSPNIPFTPSTVEIGLCPDCLKTLEEWMEGASVQAEPDLSETTVAKAFREFGENLKELRKNQLKGL